MLEAGQHTCFEAFTQVSNGRSAYRHYKSVYCAVFAGKGASIRGCKSA